MKITLAFDSWRDQPFFAPRKAQEALPVPHFAHLRTTVPRRASTILKALIDLVDSANQRVFICSFLLGGGAVTEALRRAAQRLRGHVYVITALDDRALARSLSREPNRLNPEALEREIKNFEALTRHGVYVRGAENCHAKFCVVDDRAALVGSANFDMNGLGEASGQACGELGLVIEGTERVAPLGRLFRHLWKFGCQREAPPLQDGYRLSGIPTLDEPAPALEESPANSSDAVVWTGFESEAILEGINAVVSAAKRTLALGSYSFTSMRDHPELIIEPLAAARRRGVEVELLVRDRSRDLAEIGALLDLGVSVHANHVNHAKYAIADGTHGLLFSANFDGQHGLTDGVETGVWLRPAEAKEVVDWHEQTWREAATEVTRWPTLEALSRNVLWIRCERPVFFGKSEAIFGEDPAVDQCRAILQGPSLFLTEGDEAAPRAIYLVGLEDVVFLERHGTEFEARGVGRDDAAYYPLARVIAAGCRRDTLAWLPLGMEVRLPS